MTRDFADEMDKQRELILQPIGVEGVFVFCFPVERFEVNFSFL